MPVWMHSSHSFVETRTSRGVETRSSNVGWVCLRTRTSCLVLKTQKSRFGTGRMRVSHLDTETHGWGMWDSRSETKMRSSRCFRETLRYVSADRLRLQSFWSIVNKRDAFIDVQHSGWVSRVIENPRQPAIVEFGEESDGGIDLHHRFDRMPMH